MKYGTSSTRWQVIVFDYVSGYPKSEKVEEATPLLSNQGVVSVSLGRTKDSPQSTAQIEIAGSLSSQYRIGNWLIIKSKVGTFKKTTEFSEPREGIVRFIGQITDIQTRYSKAANGLFTKNTTVTVREWSGILHCPVRLEVQSAEQGLLNSSNVSAASIVFKNTTTTITDIAQAIFDPFDYVRLILSFVGFFGSGFKGTGPVFSNQSSKALVESSEKLSRSALYMPHIPQSLLDYMGMSNLKPDQAFTSEGGLVGLVLGVNDGSSKVSSTYSTKSALDSFNGVFQSFTGLQALYQNYKDRPRTAGMFTDFAQGSGAWSLIKARSDEEYNECFTDIWYFKDPSTIGPPKPGAAPSDGESSAFAKPVLIIRDKPFALQKYIASVKTEKTKWSSLDNVPRVYIDDVYIRSINVKSTFFNSPNYILPSVPGAGVSDNFPNKHLMLAFALRTVRPEMNRFGGIQHFPQTPFIATDGTGNDLSTTWFSDATKIQYLWHGLNYRFLSGSMSLKDHDIAIMVGCNISFEIQNGLKLCAHVNGVSWNFSIGADGSITNDCTIDFSHLCMITDEGLDFIPSVLINDLFTKELGDLKTAADEVGLVKSIQDINKREEDWKKLEDREQRRENRLNKER